MILGSHPKGCKVSQETNFGACGDNLCTGEQKCIPTQSWISENCIKPLQRTGKLPDKCVCNNHEKRFTVNDFFIVNDTMDTLELVRLPIINGKKSSGPCLKEWADCTSVIRMDYEAGRDCIIGTTLYPPPPLEMPDEFPPTIDPKTTVFIRAFSGTPPDSSCHHNAYSIVDILYQIESDPSSTVQIDATRKRPSKCTFPESNPSHNFEGLTTSRATTTSTGSLKASSQLAQVGGGPASVMIVTIKGGSSNGNGKTCPPCKPNFTCDPSTGQCIFQTTCSKSSECELDWYCKEGGCVFGCTETSDNCASGKTCMNGVCTATGANGNGGGGLSREQIILIVVIGIIVFIVIVMGIVYFIYASNRPTVK